MKPGMSQAGNSNVMGSLVSSAPWAASPGSGFIVWSDSGVNRLTLRRRGGNVGLLAVDLS